MQSCWEILGIERTNDKLEIRKAYTKLAHTISPEEDPEGFQSCQRRERLVHDAGLFPDL